MTEAWIKNGYGGRYLLCAPPASDTSFERDMINSMEAKNILRPSDTFEEGEAWLSFDITGCLPLSERFAGEKLGYNDILSLVAGLNELAENLMDHLLSEENILLGENGVFAEKDTGSLKFCIHPDPAGTFSRRLNLFFAGLLEAVDLDDTEALNLSVRLFRESAREGCRMYDIMDVLLKGGSAKDAPAPLAGQPAGEKPQGPAVETKPGEFKGVTLEELDDVDENELLNEINGTAATDKQDTWARALFPQAILIFCMAAVYIVKGRDLAMHILPLYFVFALCLAAYSAAVWFVGRKKKKRPAPGP